MRLSDLRQPNRWAVRDDMAPASVETPEAGAHLIQATQLVATGEVRGEAGWVVPYPAEYRHVGVDAGLLTSRLPRGFARDVAGAA